MEVRKVFRAGNSFAVSIPADWVREMDLEKNHVEILRQANGDIILRPIRKPEPPISEDFAKTVDDFMEKYHDALKALSQR